MLSTKYYKCKSNGATYEAVAISKGAGKLRGTELIVYKCPITDNLYHREVADFVAKMEPIRIPAPPKPPEPTESRTQCSCGRSGRKSEFKPCWLCRKFRKA